MQKIVDKINTELTNTKGIDVVFNSSEEMENLNKEYRQKEGPTDVLSFNIEENVNEIYICPGYIQTNFKGDTFFEEIVRCIIHGVLHINGYDHEGKFVQLEEDSEEMFKIQEKVLNKVLER